MEFQKLVNAVRCAIAVLDGTGGGYTPEVKQESKVTLMTLLGEMEQPGVNIIMTGHYDEIKTGKPSV